uniref:Uncharacterized protein n=1 Tax=Anopheles funestus TaxID=62324 RepID=A0A1I8JUU5_ANOFN
MEAQSHFDNCYHGSDMVDSAFISRSHTMALEAIVAVLPTHPTGQNKEQCLPAHCEGRHKDASAYSSYAESVMFAQRHKAIVRLFEQNGG